MPTALITGASSGIGEAFAHELAGNGYDIVLVGRNLDKLNDVSANIEKQGVKTEIFVADLASDDGVDAVEKRLTDGDKPIDFLVNNAGFSIRGAFAELPLKDHLEILDVNATVVLRLTYAALRVMRERDSGDIINMSSVAAYTPGVRPSSTYAASKAFVAALTEGLAPSVHKTGVHLSVVCPGWTRSNFHNAAGIGISKLPNFMWLTPEEVASSAVQDHRAGKVVTVPGLVYKIIIGFMRAMPRPMVRGLSHIAGRLSH